MERKFYICRHCGNLITKLNDLNVNVVCCGEAMELLTANTVDASFEKHVPIIEQDENGVTVRVGSIDHPMLPEHYIMWVFLEMTAGGAFKYLKPGDEPVATFNLTNETVVNVYSYCNLHGLWVSENK